MEGKLSFILLAALLCVTAGELTAASSPAGFIRASCQSTQYPALCVQCLTAYAPTVRRSNRQLALAALAVSADRARSASTFVSQMSDRPSLAGSRGSRSGGAAVRDCMETLGDSVDRLRRSVQEMGRMGRAGSQRFAWHLSTVQTWVSAALTDQSTCLDGLSLDTSNNDGFRAAMRSKIVDVSRVTSNALALVNRLGSKK